MAHTTLIQCPNSNKYLSNNVGPNKIENLGAMCHKNACMIDHIQLLANAQIKPTRLIYQNCNLKSYDQVYIVSECPPIDLS